MNPTGLPDARLFYTGISKEVFTLVAQTVHQ
jgi:hypothetical protein